MGRLRTQERQGVAKTTLLSVPGVPVRALSLTVPSLNVASDTQNSPGSIVPFFVVRGSSHSNLSFTLEGIF